jgi:D-glycero-D-manno-heptose 1,7-bisphosphate phosphatase
MRQLIVRLIRSPVSHSIGTVFSIHWAQQYNGPMYPAILLDRDGVLIDNRSDYVRDWSQVKIIPEAIHALSLTPLKNYKIVIVTNQSAIGRGLVLQANAQEINRRLVNLIHHHGGQVDGVYMCPHKPDDDCFCRKPKPGLLLQAARELSLNLQRSWMIGDAWSDLQAGQRAGVRHTILLKTGRGAEQLLQPCPEEIASHLIFDNLPLAFDAIFAIGNAQAI